MYKKDHLGQRPFKVFPKTPPSLPNWESNRPLVPLFYPEVGMSMQESRFLRILKIFLISLLDLDFEAFSFHFSLSISILSHFQFTFHSWSRAQGIFISLFTLDLDLEPFSFHFSFSISIARHFHFTFHSRNEWNWFSFHFSLLEMSEPDFHFTFHFSNFQYPLSQDTGRGCTLHSWQWATVIWVFWGWLYFLHFLHFLHL